MRYSVILEPVRDPGFEGYYYAHIPTLDLTTHGEGVEGGLAAARDLAGTWIAERRTYVAVHPGDVPMGTFRAIPRQIRMSDEEFREL